MYYLKNKYSYHWRGGYIIRLLVLALLFSYCIFSPGLVAAGDTDIDASLVDLPMTASAANTSPGFYKFLYSFPLNSPAMFSGLSGSVSIASHGQGFAQALISVQDIPAGNACPQNGETYGNNSAIRARYPAMQELLAFIVKEPVGTDTSTMPTKLMLPAGIPVSGCLVVILDGSVRRVGGPFVMTSNMVARLSPAPLPIGLGDEFCFGIKPGCQRATLLSSPQSAFMRVVPVTQAGTLLALFGDISNSTLGGTGTDSGTVPWSTENSYYIYPNCTLHAGIAGPDDYYATIPPQAKKLYSLVMRGSGQASLQQPVYQPFTGVMLHPADCIVHLVRSTGVGVPQLGGIDAENQVVALIQPQKRD